MMKEEYGIFKSPSSKNFILFKDTIIGLSKSNPNYSMFLDYLFFRYCDAYDSIVYKRRLKGHDKSRYNLEKIDVYKRLIGPFYLGRDSDKLDDLKSLDFKEIISKIIASNPLDNKKMEQYLKDASCTNVYDLYNSLYIQRLEEPTLKDCKTFLSSGMDLEYDIWTYQILDSERFNKKRIDIFKCKDKWMDMYFKYRSKKYINPNEPNDLNGIVALSKGIDKTYKIINYKDKLKGAIIGRFIGCVLGVPVEQYSIEKMASIAQKTNSAFPPINYWNYIDNESSFHYKRDPKIELIRDNISYVAADDDVTYTVMNLLLCQKYGYSLTSTDISSFWRYHLPYACTAEYEAMLGLRKNIKNDEYIKNPYVELIGAAIRADAFGYVCAGDPIKARKMAYNDAILTHRNSGLYAEIYIACAIALSFKYKPLKACALANDYIPSNSRLHKQIKWALSNAKKVHSYLEARELLNKKFKIANQIFANSNIAAIIFALYLGHDDFDATISNCIAIGLDNDCTGASIGSLFGAHFGLKAIPTRWYKCFNNKVHTYIRGYETISITNLVNIATKLYKSKDN